MGIFSSSDDSDDGCTGHHYGEYTRDYGSISTSISKRNLAALGMPAIEIKVPKVAQCQHYGCNDTRTKGDMFRDTVTVPLIDLGDDPSDVAAQLREYAERVEECGADPHRLSEDEE